MTVEKKSILDVILIDRSRYYCSYYEVLSSLDLTCIYFTKEELPMVIKYLALNVGEEVHCFDITFGGKVIYPRGPVTTSIQDLLADLAQLTL